MMSSLPLIRSVDDVLRNCDCLVEVKAQVMARDNVLGMWGPLDGGGMSLVGLYQSPCSTLDNDISLMQYIIIGHRLLDKRIILKCLVSLNFQYTKVNPTFHHWAVDDKRFGLTFEASSDASAFEKTITRVVENLKSMGPPLVSCPRSNVISQKYLQKIVDKERCVVVETDERPSLPVKMRCKPNVPAGQSCAGSTCYNSGPLALTDDHIVSVCSLDSISGLTKLSDSALTQRSSSAEACTGSTLKGSHGSPTVPYPPRRHPGVYQLKQFTEPLTCPRRPARMRDHDQPSHVDMLSQTHCTLVRSLENPVSVPRCPITPKVVVKSGIDKKRARTPPLPNVPLETSLLNDYLLDLSEKSVHVDQTSSAFDTNSGEVREAPSVYVASSYVQFMKGNVNTYVDKNEYFYPNFESTSSSSGQSTGVVSSYQDYRNPERVASQQPPILLPMKTSPHPWYIAKPKELAKNYDLVRTDSANFKSRCTYCGEFYLPKSNRRGVCADGPDSFRDCLKKCNCCAQALLYHCADDEDGNDTDLWTCGACDRRSCRQWTILTFLCLLLPCMWCFLPLRTCHRCGVAFGCCGARHRPAVGPLL